MTDAPTTNPGRILLVLFLGVLMAALDIAIVGPALPALRAHFGVDDRTLAWVFTMFVLFNLVGVPLMAKLSDVFGRRTIFTLDVILFAVGSLTVALAPSFAVLLVGRGLQGLSASGIFPAATAMIGDTFPAAKHGRALGVLGAVFGVAFIAGPFLGGMLLLIGWQWLFLMSLPLAAVVLVMGLRLLPPSPPRASRTLDWRGILVLGVMLVALAYGVNQIDTAAFWSSLAAPRTWPALLLAAVLVPVFLAVERRAAEPLVRLQLFTSRQVVLASLLAAGAGLAQAAFIFFPSLAVIAYGVTDSTASFMLLPLMVAIALSAPLTGRILDHTGSKTIVLLCALALTLGMALMALAGDVPAAFYGGSVLIGFGLAGLLGSALNYILLNEALEAERTIAQGVITLSINIGQLLGGAFIGAVVASRGGSEAGYYAAFLVIAGIGLVITVMALGLKSRAEERRSLIAEA